ncbi:MAG: MORN repeat-containing protein [Minwuia sp.]|uniref:MORN repeat-containing protein n=1 Tax=Minwuia sp. TaxID=2493630 RepID=UPI003A857F8D
MTVNRNRAGPLEANRAGETIRSKKIPLREAVCYTLTGGEQGKAAMKVRWIRSLADYSVPAGFTAIGPRVLLLTLLFAAIGTSSRADSDYLIDQDAAEMQLRPVCVGRQEAVRYARALIDYMAQNSTADVPGAIGATQARTAGNGGSEFDCYVMVVKPVYFAEPADVVDVMDTHGAPGLPAGQGVLLARADVIDENGEVLARRANGDYLYAMPVARGEVVQRNAPSTAMTAPPRVVDGPENSGFAAAGSRSESLPSATGTGSAEDEFTGHRSVTYDDGVTYDGGWLNGKFHGHGIITWPNGDRYEGGFLDNKKHGTGVYIWGSGSRWAGDRYEGEFRDGKRNGHGVYTYADGRPYEGDFQDRVFHGQGVFTWPEGHRFVGSFADDRIQGYGTMWFPNGDWCAGVWERSGLIGSGNGVIGGQSRTCRVR